MESIRQYWKRTDKVYLLLCIFSSTMAVLALASWAAKQGNGFATDAVTGQITGIGDYRRALVQAGAAGIGLVIALLLSCIDYRSLVKVWPVHVVLTWGLVLPTLFIRNVSVGPLTIGYNAGDTDNYSWYKLGGFTFQPTELAKISFILTLALHLSRVRGRVNQPKNLLLLLLHIGVPTALIHIQGDDGTALVFVGIGVFMLYAGGLSNWVAGGALAVGVVGGGALLKLRPGILKGYQFKRILAVITPDDPNLADITYQQNKGAMAIGTGGLTGTGLFTPEHIFVPNAWNDFIFAYLANVLGFVGAAAVLALLLGVCLRTLTAALQSRDALGRNICVGIFAALFLQTVINLGMNLQVLPVIGVTLPFFSAGGSSVVMMYFCVGLVLSVGLQARRSRVDAVAIL